MSTARDLERRFITTVSSWIVSLPHDIRVLFEAKDDPNLDRPAREIAAGAILTVLTKDKSGEADFVGFAEDAIILREALTVVAAQGGEGAQPFRERFAEYYQTLDDDLAVCRTVMGETYAWLAEKMEGLTRIVYKGKKISQYIDDDEEIELVYEDGLAFSTDFPIDEEKLGMRFKKVETLLDPLRRIAADERRTRGKQASQ